MPKPSDEFKQLLTDNLNARAGEKKFVLPGGFEDKLFEMLLNLFDGCLGGLAPAGVAQQISVPSKVLKFRLRKQVKRAVFKGNDKAYDSQGGEDMADATLESTAAMGQEKCLAFVTEMREGDNWFPNQDLFMG